MLSDVRRSTRVPLRLLITALELPKGSTCEGETVTVNLHGGLIRSALAFRVGQKIQLEVLIAGKKAEAEVVWSDPEKPLTCGVALAKPQNIWGVALPPDDWLRYRER
jgi:hypothetical protein